MLRGALARAAHGWRLRFSRGAWLVPRIVAPRAQRRIDACYPVYDVAMSQGAQKRARSSASGGAVDWRGLETELREACLLYTSDAADDLLCVDLGGRRIIKKKKKKKKKYTQ